MERKIPAGRRSPAPGVFHGFHHGVAAVRVAIPMLALIPSAASITAFLASSTALTPQTALKVRL
ncbi:MAG: hypothetical protein ACTSWP_01700 [Candidatus Freyarchaeota archaeon]|nr:hypothetical protein [Candidatus Freyrarchaeum guaymaensis]